MCSKCFSDGTFHFIYLLHAVLVEKKSKSGFKVGPKTDFSLTFIRSWISTH